MACARLLLQQQHQHHQHQQQVQQTRSGHAKRLVTHTREQTTDTWLSVSAVTRIINPGVGRCVCVRVWTRRWARADLTDGGAASGRCGFGGWLATHTHTHARRGEKHDNKRDFAYVKGLRNSNDNYLGYNVASRRVCGRRLPIQCRGAPRLHRAVLNAPCSPPLRRRRRQGGQRGGWRG